eukprot:UN33067
MDIDMYHLNYKEWQQSLEVESCIMITSTEVTDIAEHLSSESNMADLWNVHHYSPEYSLLPLLFKESEEKLNRLNEGQDFDSWTWRWYEMYVSMMAPAAGIQNFKITGV